MSLRPLIAAFALGAVVSAAAVVSPSADAATKSPLGGIPDSCVEVCPDGYMFASCTEDGHQINYFADPCLGHRGSSSSSSAADDCGPNTMLCARDRTPSCIEGKWRCVKASAAAQSDVKISALTPKYPRIGKRLTIKGEGFTPKENVVHIGTNVVRDVYSADGKTMTFLLPRIIKPACLYEEPMCKIGLVKMEPGTYDVHVVNGDGEKSATTSVKIIELR